MIDRPHLLSAALSRHCRKGNVLRAMAVIDALWEANLDLDAPSTSGLSPLATAVRWGHPPLTLALLAAGGSTSGLVAADPTMKRLLGLSRLDAAMEWADPKWLVRALESERVDEGLGKRLRLAIEFQVAEMRRLGQTEPKHLIAIDMVRSWAAAQAARQSLADLGLGSPMSEPPTSPFNPRGLASFRP